MTMQSLEVLELLRENESLKKQLKALQKELDTDALTKVRSHRKLIEIQERRQPGGCLLVVAFDLIDFGNYNKIYGHHEGDRVLKMFAEKLVKVFRSSDRVYRRGGDEFVAILEVNDLLETDLQYLESIKYRLAAFKITPFAYIGFAKSKNLSCSVERLIIEAFGEIEEIKRQKLIRD